MNTRISDPISVAGKIQYDITDGTRAGQNLFHSFGEFGVPTNTIANFLNNSGAATSNILGRVTGGNVTNIFGMIQTTGFGNSNLFLMNPAGIVFGPNATLNVGGSVAFTTANYLRLTDNVRFNAIPSASADAMLSTAPIAAYGFLGSPPGAITVQGSQLTVLEGGTLSLVGGNITIQNGPLRNGTGQPAHLSAPQGHINLATTQTPGEFLESLAVVPNMNDVSFTSYGSVRFAPGSILDGRHTGNGQISIRGGQLVLEVQNAVLDTSGPTLSPVESPSHDLFVAAPGSSLVSHTSSSDRGPNVSIRADQITLLGNPTIQDQPVTRVTTFT